MSFEPPTEKEIIVIKELKQLIKGDCVPNVNVGRILQCSDTTILRFYRGHSNDKNKALDGILAHHRWREENKIDSILQNTQRFNREFEKEKIITGSADLNGRPVCFCPTNRHDCNDRDADEMVLYSVYCIEKMLAMARPEDERIVICYLLDKFNMKFVDYEFAEKFFTMLQQNYPETLETVFFVDAPMFFSAVWAMVRMWIDPVTASKVKFIKSHEMTKYFPEESIPRSY